MGSKNTSALKVKITTSLDPDLVSSIDKYLKESKIRSRSQFIEDVLRTWQMEQKKRNIESEIEQYYQSLTDKERKEDHEWADIAGLSASHIWEE